MPSAYDDGVVPLAGMVDRSCPFIADSLAPLYYTPIWTELSADQRLTYNQINGTYWNELIAWFEMELATATLRVVGREQSLRARIQEFIREEALHAAVFHDLNRLSDPVRYRDSQRSLLSVPAALSLVLRAGAVSGFAPALLWIMLLVEERSIAVMSISCRAGIDPLYARVYRAHAVDEAKHVAIDLELLDGVYRSLNRTWRQMNATLLAAVLRRFLLEPGRAAKRIVEAFTTQHVELRDLKSRMLTELTLVGSMATYRRSMYSDEMTPRTIERLRALPEMAGVVRMLT